MFFLTCSLFQAAQSAGGQAVGVLSSGAESRWPPPGRSLRFEISSDTLLSAAEGEQTGGKGGAGKLKLKGIMEFALLDADLEKLRGKTISAALLHLRSASAAGAPLARVGVSTVAARWAEGKSGNYRPRSGISTFLQAVSGGADWSYPGSTVLDVVFGKGHTIWKFADCSQPDDAGWQSCAVSADVVAARVAGISDGFCLSDEVGHIWSLKNGTFKYKWFPNRLFFSRESRDSAPWLEVWVDGEDAIPPEPIGTVAADSDGLPAGEAILTWRTPPDRGGGKTLGFFVEYMKDGRKQPMPRYLVPMAAGPGEDVRMHVQDLPFGPGETVEYLIRPVDSAGNVGQPFKGNFGVSPGPEKVVVPSVDITSFAESAERIRLGSLTISVIDLLDKIKPVGGGTIPEQRTGYFGGNHLFSAKEKRIRLQGARNEAVCFQLNLAGRANRIEVAYDFGRGSNLTTTVTKLANVTRYNKKRPVEVLPDPLVPSRRSFSLPDADGNSSVAGQDNQSLICEVYIPHAEDSGPKSGKLVIEADGKTVAVDVDLTVWNFTLPDKLSFIPEMNAYGKVSPFKSYDAYRLAHEHRTCLNRLPYAWDGRPNFAPRWNGKSFDWSGWDFYVGPLVDGSAFSDLPRKGEPVDVLYLPFSENWPASLYDHYRPSYWIEEAFDSQYREQLGAAFSEFAKHCNEEGWNETIFQFYLNNKLPNRRRFKRSSAPWIFDEPVHTQDFWALRWYGLLWQQSVQPVRGNANMWYRADISRTQYARNLLWGIVDVEYIGGNTAQKTRMKLDEIVLHGNTYFAEYGTANRIEDPNTQPVLWCLSAWSKGAMGVLPWQTIGTKRSWERAEQTALFYPDPRGEFLPSVRLKAFRRGQQDVEYLQLLCDVLKVPCYAVADWLKSQINLKEQYYKTSRQDAGTAVYGDISPMQLWNLRYRIGKFLSAKAPPYRRSLVDWKQPAWDPASLPDVGYVKTAPRVDSRRPVCDRFRPGAP